KFAMTVSAYDCTGCGSCANVCPGKKGEKALVMENMEANGAGNVGTTYSSDAFWQSFGESFQSYVEGSASREDTIAKIEKDWQEIDGADQ
ncbi:MAG: 4Fe-4S binding protein, partial [Eubacterium sp.]|nr:4Fe-4S binding protein [Eubacterium sp.]